MPVNTIDAIVLLGWMQKEEAVQYLLQNCIFDPPIDRGQAEALWERYQSEVEAMPTRCVAAPERLPIDNHYEREAVADFKTRFQGSGNILDVIKIDPMALVVHQLWIATERSNGYINSVDSTRGWIRHCLLPEPISTQLQIRTGLNAIDVCIPHAEFTFFLHPQQGLQIQQMARHVSTTAFDDRLLLSAGYHRSYARICSMAPDAIDRSLLVALTTDGTFLVSPDSPNHGVREMLKGSRPPLFRDFFDERFFMRIKLRKKRYELQIRGQIVGLDDES